MHMAGDFYSGPHHRHNAMSRDNMLKQDDIQCIFLLNIMYLHLLIVTHLCHQSIVFMQATLNKILGLLKLYAHFGAVPSRMYHGDDATYKFLLSHMFVLYKSTYYIEN
jgi:hypothetical protein